MIPEDRRRAESMAEVPLGPDSLVGSFYQLLEDDVIVEQGIVVAEPQAGVYLLEVQFVDALNHQRVTSIEHMFALDEQEWRFFDNQVQMHEAYIKHLNKTEARS